MSASQNHDFSDSVLGAFGLNGNEEAIQQFIQRDQEINGSKGKKTCRDLRAYEQETGINPVEDIPGYFGDAIQVRHLDAGCGRAVASGELARKFPGQRVRVCAVDILAPPKVPDGVEFVKRDLTEFCHPECYHLIGMPFVVPYIPDPLKALANMYNSLEYPHNGGNPSVLGFSCYPESIRVDGFPIDHRRSEFRRRLNAVGADCIILERPNESGLPLYDGMVVMQVVKWRKGRLDFNDLRSHHTRPELGFPVDVSYSSE